MAAGRSAGCARERCRQRLCVGFGAAAKLAMERHDADHEHIERLWRIATAGFGPEWTINGSTERRYHGNLNIRREGLDGARLLADLRNVAISLGLGLRQRIGTAEPCAARDRPDRPRGALLDSPRLRPLRRRGRAGQCGRPDRRGRPGAERASGVTRVRFLRPDGSLDREVDAPAGSRLLEVAQAAGQPLEGSCEGAMACSTCHVIVAAEDFGRLPPASEDEDDMLDLAAGLTSYIAARLPDSAER